MTVPARRVTREALSYLRRYKLDPSRIGEDNVDQYGYDEYAFDENDNLIVLPDGKLLHYRRQWPEGFDYELWFELLGEVREDDVS